ncbi:unnamed protein product [Lactuca virosa]|uniref:Uncharacterized protein n=1 Tax=Lactuca virosa TaxID=75947 RepID=A0AAU9PU96_9ASTR|nr:unnamed protein product [Lactuca virosa]
MVFSKFIAFLEKLTKTICKGVYYCLLNERLSEGLGVIQNEEDYREFIEVGNGIHAKRINVYNDQYNEPVFDWIEDENLDKDDVTIEYENLEEEVDDSIFSGLISYEHKEDEVVSIPKPLDDPFLNALCHIKKEEDGSDIDELEEEVDVKPMYYIHDPI